MSEILTHDPIPGFEVPGGVSVSSGKATIRHPNSTNRDHRTQVRDHR